MRLFKRKSQVQRLGDNIMASLDPSGRNPLRGALPNNGKALKAALDKDAAVKVGLAAGGLTALTAASAGISSLRRRHEGASRDSQS
jgi:hypothetical protein